jgi:hypothetical protein
MELAIPSFMKEGMPSSSNHSSLANTDALQREHGHGMIARLFAMQFAYYANRLSDPVERFFLCFLSVFMPLP